MSTLEELIDTSGDEAKELIKNNLLELIKGAKSESESVIKETAEKIEKWTKLKLEGKIDSLEYEDLVDSRRSTVEQFLNSQEIETRARLEKVSIGLIDLVLDKALDAII